MVRCVGVVGGLVHSVVFLGKEIEMTKRFGPTAAKEKPSVLEDIFDDLANNHCDGDTIAYLEIKEDLKKMYELGRTSMMIELEMRESLLCFKNVANNVKNRKAITKLMTDKMEDFRERGIIAPAWEPKFHIEQGKDDPSRIDIIPDDEETAKWFRTIQQQGNY